MAQYEIALQQQDFFVKTMGSRFPQFPDEALRSLAKRLTQGRYKFLLALYYQNQNEQLLKEIQELI